ncbi:hypothetical protein GLOIN_2v1574082 [Rhizophagus clarus]|uniref:Uncharacterized protein n=1 Tax=Rhizophagus clarus TaxID=94130 RepID=A0A8H3LH13_9GLOM|nr:hypothetical protein GLOIN_2v1574082 [Rhizophagus clarus]
MDSTPALTAFYHVNAVENWKCLNIVEYYRSKKDLRLVANSRSDFDATRRGKAQKILDDWKPIFICCIVVKFGWKFICTLLRNSRESEFFIIQFIWQPPTSKLNNIIFLILANHVCCFAKELDYTSEELKTKMCKRQCWESADKAGKPTFNWNDAIHNYNCIILGKRHRGMKVGLPALSADSQH